VAVNRAAEQGDFTAAERALAARLYPHLETAIRRVLAAGSERDGAEALVAHLDGLTLPSARVDWALRMRYSNRAAREVILRWESLRPGGARAQRVARAPALPREIRAACLAMKQEYRALARANTPLPALAYRVVAHPDAPGLRACLRPLHLRADSPQRPSFWIHWEGEKLGLHDTRDANLLILRELSPREREVAVAVSRGLANREIAVQLGTGIRTIESQLRSVFQKLNIRCRAQLIALLK
jgi:DNA-binding CsgD family transcriptional regulator